MKNIIAEVEYKLEETKLRLALAEHLAKTPEEYFKDISHGNNRVIDKALARMQREAMQDVKFGYQGSFGGMGMHRPHANVASFL